MGLLDDIRSGAYRPSASLAPPPSAQPTQTLARVARRAAEGDDFRVAVREFLDEFALVAPSLRRRMLHEEPPLTGDERHDAFLGALAEHLAVRQGERPPSWCLAPARFLDRFWFVSPTEGFRAISLAQAPVAFKRRGVLIPERSLERV
jgi:hypothetical protein